MYKLENSYFVVFNGKYHSTHFWQYDAEIFYHSITIGFSMYLMVLFP